MRASPRHPVRDRLREEFLERDALATSHCSAIQPRSLSFGWTALA
jgi:hypothetical protein